MATIKLGNLKVNTEYIFIKEKSISSIRKKLDTHIRDAMGDLSLYRQKYSVECDDYLNDVDYNLHAALNIIEGIE